MYALPMAQTPTTYSAMEAEMGSKMDESMCAWCEDEQATRYGWDEHNGQTRLCETCAHEAEVDGLVTA